MARAMAWSAVGNRSGLRDSLSPYLQRRAAMVQAYHKEFQLLLLPDKWECNLDAMYCQRWYPAGYLPF